MIANIIAVAVIVGISVFAVATIVKKYRRAKITGNPECIGCCGCHADGGNNGSFCSHCSGKK